MSREMETEIFKKVFIFILEIMYCSAYDHISFLFNNIETELK